LFSGCGKAQPTLAGGKPVSYWVKVLRGPDAKLRKKAAFKLGNVGPTDATVLPALVRALKDADAGVRCEAILAVLKCGDEAKEAVPALTEVQRQDRDAKVRAYAAKALEKLQGNEGRVSRGPS
jgi:HEAT repeat protein